jgi:hypothetical protein
MRSCTKKFMAGFLAALLTAAFSWAPAGAKECENRSQQDPGLMAADVALARPAGTVATVAGFVVFLVSSPFSALGGNSSEAWNSLVVSPAHYTFKRPLGHFDCEELPKEKQR